MAKKRVAIVGGGVSGMAAFWALQYSPHDVHLYEATNLTGTLTQHAVCDVGDRKVQIDAGLTLFNPDTSPNLMAFLRALGLPVKSKMFSISTTGMEENAYEMAWGSFPGVRTLFGFRSLFNPSMWTLRLEILNFNFLILDFLRDPLKDDRDSLLSYPSGGSQESSPVRKEADRISLEDYLRRHNFSDRFFERYLIPLLSVLWNLGDVWRIMDLPVDAVFRHLWENGFCNGHHLWPAWAVLGHSANFRAALRHLPADKLHTDAPIASVTSDRTKISFTLQLENGGKEIFDHVIFAMPGKDALHLLKKDPNLKLDESVILRGFQETKAMAIIHSDESHMPRSKQAWSLINHTKKAPSDTSTRPTITYWMNQFHSLDCAPGQNIFITLNPRFPTPKIDLVHGVWELGRPMIDREALACQRELPRIQNTRGISYCGSWTGFGTHEDGVRSAFEVVVDHLGAELPFDVADTKNTQKSQIPRITLAATMILLIVRIIPHIIMAIRALIHLVTLVAVLLKIRRFVRRRRPTPTEDTHDD